LGRVPFFYRAVDRAILFLIFMRVKNPLAFLLGRPMCRDLMESPVLAPHHCVSLSSCVRIREKRGL